MGTGLVLSPSRAAPPRWQLGVGLRAGSREACLVGSPCSGPGYVTEACTDTHVSAHKHGARTDAVTVSQVIFGISPSVGPLRSERRTWLGPAVLVARTQSAVGFSRPMVWLRVSVGWSWAQGRRVGSRWEAVERSARRRGAVWRHAVGRVQPQVGEARAGNSRVRTGEGTCGRPQAHRRTTRLLNWDPVPLLMHLMSARAEAWGQTAPESVFGCRTCAFQEKDHEAKLPTVRQVQLFTQKPDETRWEDGQPD